MKSNLFSYDLADYADGPPVTKDEVAHQNILLLMERMADRPYRIPSYLLENPS